MFAKLFHDLLFAFRFWNVSDKQAQVGNTDIDFERLALFDLIIVELWNEARQMVSGHHRIPALVPARSALASGDEAPFSTFQTLYPLNTAKRRPGKPNV